MRNELTFENHENGLKVAQMLLDEGYVVLLSYEEDLLVINYEWSEYCDRNDFIFMRKDEYHELEDCICAEILANIRNDIKKGLIKSLSDI